MDYDDYGDDNEYDYGNDQDEEKELDYDDDDQEDPDRDEEDDEDREDIYEREEREDREDTYEYAEEDRFVAERAAFERAGGGRATLVDLVTSAFEKTKKLEEIQRRLIRSGLNDEERFKVILQGYINKFREDLSITDRDVNNISEILTNIRHLKYKNPPSFLMGYYVLKNRSIDKNRLKQAESLVKDDDVFMPDIVRYARLIQNFL